MVLGYNYWVHSLTKTGSPLQFPIWLLKVLSSPDSKDFTKFTQIFPPVNKNVKLLINITIYYKVVLLYANHALITSKLKLNLPFVNKFVNEITYLNFGLPPHEWCPQSSRCVFRQKQRNDDYSDYCSVLCLPCFLSCNSQTHEASESGWEAQATSPLCCSV